MICCSSHATVSQLFQGSQSYRVARWPNSDWLFTKQPIEHIKPYHNSSFSFGIDSQATSRIKHWHSARCFEDSCDHQHHWSPRDLWMTGYFSYGWAESVTVHRLIEWNAANQLQWEQYSQAKLLVERSAWNSLHCVRFGACLVSNELS